MLKKIFLGILIILVLAGAGFVAWGSVTNPIMPAASTALIGGSGVEVTQSKNPDWLIFQPAQKNVVAGLIFYPGGKVDYRAYAPYARQIAEQGFLVVIPRMPLNLAVFDPDEAAKVIQAFPKIKVWAVGGHSLGGSMAAHYAAQHPGQISGLVLLASYPANSDSLVKSGVQVLSIYGTQDGLATSSKIEASKALLPVDVAFVAIQGGNHGQFGDYGLQSGDGAATISRAAQQMQAVNATVKLLQRLSGK